MTLSEQDREEVQRVIDMAQEILAKLDAASRECDRIINRRSNQEDNHETENR